MPAQENADRGPIWRDVSELVDALARRWGGVWNVSIRSHPGRGRGGHLWVVCERTNTTDRAGAYDVQHAGAAYPTHDRVSLPALVCGLLYELDAKLEANDKLAARQASF